MSNTWITGGKGFIGKHLARYVASQGHMAAGMGHGLWSSEDALEWGYSYWSNAEIEAANLNQLANISGLPDTIFHLAGGSAVGTSLQHPYEDFRRTVDTTAQLLEWVRQNSPNTKVVAVSSAAVYGAGHDGAISENAALSPYSPYGAHKSMMECLCRSYAENFGLRVAIVRLFSVYGAELEKQLIWDLCRKLAQADNEPVMLGGSGEELRDWLHVSDAAELLWLARSRCDASCSIINGGTGMGISIRDVAGLVCTAWGAVADVKFSGIARKGDPDSLIADCQLATQLGFKPRVTLPEGIYEAVHWFKSRK